MSRYVPISFNQYVGVQAEFVGKNPNLRKNSEYRNSYLLWPGTNEGSDCGDRWRWGQVKFLWRQNKDWFAFSPLVLILQKPKRYFLAGNYISRCHSSMCGKSTKQGVLLASTLSHFTSFRSFSFLSKVIHQFPLTWPIWFIPTSTIWLWGEKLYSNQISINLDHLRHFGLNQFSGQVSKASEEFQYQRAKLYSMYVLLY